MKQIFGWTILLILFTGTGPGASVDRSGPGSPDKIPAVAAFLGSHGFDRMHSNAPAQTRQFGRLVGIWEARTELRQRDGTWAESAPGLWVWKYALDGFAVQDLWYQGADHLPDYMKDFGRDYLLTSMRIFKVSEKQWQVAWMANGAGKSPGKDYGTFEARLVDGRMVMTGPPIEGFGLQRVIFSDITADSFHWQSEFSNDEGKTWRAVYQIRAKRQDESGSGK